jgi:hypothetical protein
MTCRPAEPGLVHFPDLTTQFIRLEFIIPAPEGSLTVSSGNFTQNQIRIHFSSSDQMCDRLYSSTISRFFNSSS